MLIAERHLFTSDSICSLESKQGQGGVQLLVLNLKFILVIVIMLLVLMAIDMENRG